MSYAREVMPSCQKVIDKLCRKNPVLTKILDNKITEIIQNPHHYKTLRHGLTGERRVHIFKSFILKFIINEQNKTVIFIFFGHHDKAY